MKIFIPSKVKSNFGGYNFFIGLYNQLHNSNDNDFYISFKNSIEFDANLASILRAINDTVRAKNKNVELIDIPSELEDVFIKNNFISSDLTPNIENTHKGSATIPFMKFTPFQDIEFMEYVENELLSKTGFPKHSLMLGKKINTSIFELFENARTHGHCDNIYTCGQIITNDDVIKLDFTIVDMGDTIKKNVNEYLIKVNELHKESFTGAAAIEWALKSGNTTKMGNVSGGLGLDIIFEFVKWNKGRIQIISSDGYWGYYHNKRVKRTFNNPFNGTIANIEIDLNDAKEYKLKEEISLKDIF